MKNPVLEKENNIIEKDSNTKPKKPNLWQVFILNDDYTHAHFVVHVLQEFFGMDQQTATAVMMQAHKSGKAICGVFAYDIAETKVHLVKNYAKQHEHPLNCDMEELFS